MSITALDSMRALAPSSRVITLEAGDVIFRSGDPGDSLYGVLEGKVRLTWPFGPPQNSTELADSTETPGIPEEIEPGEVFGAGALASPGHVRTNEARALTSCRLLVMNREEFLFALQESPVFSLEMLASLENRLKRKNVQR